MAARKSLPEILAALGQVAEGVYSAQEVHQIAQRNGVDMPICEAVYRVIYQQLDPHQAVHALLTRSIKAES
jgi:glycerol-3-phosphate dehydrogenase (NAD(P)+)